MVELGPSCRFGMASRCWLDAIWNVAHVSTSLPGSYFFPFRLAENGRNGDAVSMQDPHCKDRPASASPLHK